MRIPSMFALSILALLGSTSAHASSISFVPSSSRIGPINSEAGIFPTGNYQAFTNPLNIALGHGVTVSGTIPGFPIIHDAANITDGNYGKGRSWIGLGSDSWLVIDLGGVRTFDTLSFGRDRLGFLTDRNPGQFTISISNDNSAFTSVFDSASFGFNGILGVTQTVQANFNAVNARFVKLQLAADGAAVDEVEIKLTTAVIPEPATLALIGLGLPALRLGSRRRSPALEEPSL